MFEVVLYTAIVNTVGFGVFALDKLMARLKLRRISERILLLLAATGGTGGIFIAQHLLRHKTRKQPFKSYLIAIAIIQVLFVGAYLTPYGQNIIHSVFLSY